MARPKTAAARAAKRARREARALERDARAADLRVRRLAALEADLPLEYVTLDAALDPLVMLVLAGTFGGRGRRPVGLLNASDVDRGPLPS